MSTPLPFDLATLFPMSEPSSARLMKLKARCLAQAGIIARHQERAVVRRADDLLRACRAQEAQAA